MGELEPILDQLDASDVEVLVERSRGGSLFAFKRELNRCQLARQTSAKRAHGRILPTRSERTRFETGLQRTCPLTMAFSY